MIKKYLIISALVFGLTSGSILAAEASVLGVVNFTTCITDSKYGKNEQTQLENIKNQWTSIIEQTEKELKDVMAKFEDQEYLDGLSPEAEQELKMKYKALNEDMAKYQNQLYQVLNQANYFFLQKMQVYIAKASEQVAQKKKLSLVFNKEACFYSQADLDMTKQVIDEMDKNYEVDLKNKKVSENNEAPKAPETANKNISESAESKKLPENKSSPKISENTKDKSSVKKDEKISENLKDKSSVKKDSKISDNSKNSEKKEDSKISLKTTEKAKVSEVKK